MIDLILLATAFAFANKVVNGCSTAALILLALTAWFNYWPPA